MIDLPELADALAAAFQATYDGETITIPNASGDGHDVALKQSATGALLASSRATHRS
jgi:hypothetical protein